MIHPYYFEMSSLYKGEKHAKFDFSVILNPVPVVLITSKNNEEN